MLRSFLRFFINTSFILLFSFILSYAWIGMIDENSNFFEYVSQRGNSYTFDYYTHKYAATETINETLDLCSVLETEEQPDCVVSQFYHLYSYSHHNETVRSPDDIKEKGGVCRDAVVFYSAVFSRLDWNVRYTYPVPNHVAIEVSKDVGDGYMYCNIDQRKKDCMVIS